MNSKKNSRSGFSLPEIMIVVALTAGAGLLISQLFGNVTSQSARVTRSVQKLSVLEEWTRTVVKIFGTTSLGLLNPETSFVAKPGSAGNFVPASLIQRLPAGTCNNFPPLGADPDRNRKWCLGGAENKHIGKGAISATKVTNTNGFNQALSSHDFAHVRLKAMAGGGPLIQPVVDAVLLSRCVDSRSNSTPTTLAGLNALKRPIISGGIAKCCDIAPHVEPSGCEEITNGTYWPTIFTYKKDGTVLALPTENDRRLVPGLGFFIEFSGNPATSYTLHSFSLVNKCLTSVTSGRNCAEPKLGWSPSNQDSFSLSHTTDAGSVTGDLAGAGLIRFGGRRLDP
jgi:type II secretory pathway pseudopilin PulG